MTITHGGYLLKPGDCMACHANTADRGVTFAGGLHIGYSILLSRLYWRERHLADAKAQREIWKN